MKKKCAIRELNRIENIHGSIKSDIDAVYTIYDIFKEISKRMNVGNLLDGINSFNCRMLWSGYVTKIKKYKTTIKDGERAEYIKDGVVGELSHLLKSLDGGITTAKQLIHDKDYKNAIKTCKIQLSKVYELRSLLGIDYTK